MRLEELLSTKERVSILRKILYERGHISVTKTARELNLSKGLVSKFVEIMARDGLLVRRGKKILVYENIKVRTLKILLNLSVFDWRFFRKHSFVKSAGIYGSVTKGTDTENSDIDIWIFVEKTKEENLARLTSELKKSYGNVKPLYLTEEKIQYLKSGDAVFYHSLIFGSILLYGDGIEKI